MLLRDTLRSILSDSTQTARSNERVVEQQETALSELKNTRIRFLRDFQSGLAQVSVINERLFKNRADLVSECHTLTRLCGLW